jgi:hypothetical protein
LEASGWTRGSSIVLFGIRWIGLLRTVSSVSTGSR